MNRTGPSKNKGFDDPLHWEPQHNKPLLKGSEKSCSRKTFNSGNSASPTYSGTYSIKKNFFFTAVKYM